MSSELIHRLPAGWTENGLEGLVARGSKITYGVVQPGEQDPNGVPFVRGGDINNGKIAIGKLRTISQSVSESYKRTLLQGGELLMSLVGYPGEVAIVPESLAGANIARQAAYIKLGQSVDSQYVMYYLQSNLGKYYLFQKSTGSAQQVINLIDLKDVRVILPPLPEQKKIAAILTSVDDVIEKTQAQIDKLKDLKTGMMQELLTRGVGVNGKPHTEFKDSPVGRIPKGWEVTDLEELASFVTSGSRGWAQYYSDSGAIFIRIGNLTREHINFRFKDTIYVNPPNTAEGKRTLVQTGDVLISITADLGVIAVVNDDIGEAYVNQHVSLVRLKDKSISRWVGHFLAFEESQKQFTANNDSGAKAGLNLTAIRKTKVVLPPIEEMNKVVQSLDSLDTNIAIKRQKLSKVSDTKKALMQDLLTGKKRVKVDS
ncbi:restriction endonuclease subunit S [Vibrio splendidus]